MWHSLPETWDNELDAQIHEWYAQAKPVWPKRPYFSPSAATGCPRELYVKQTGGKRDVTLRQPHQGRWTRIGTAIGDVIQRDILFAEKHFASSTAKHTGTPAHAPFRFERTTEGSPMFEDFAKVNAEVQHGGHTFYLYGTCDGILEYTTEDGEILRVGLEIKSKQTTSAKTSLHSMREPEDKHVKQCVAYSLMYDVDYYVILYVNASKKTWEYDPAEYEKSPDIRTFGIAITNNERTDLLAGFADVLDAVKTGTPPPLDLDKWAFNGYKTACAESLTDAEVDDLRTQVERMRRSRLPEWKKAQHVEALEFIEGVRG